MKKTINHYSESELRRTSLAGWYEIYKANCLICNKTGNCLINDKGNTIACTRVESKIQFSKTNPSWIHKLNDDQKVKVDIDSKANSGFNNFKIADDAVLDQVYNIVLDFFGLLSSHKKHLKEERMLSEKTIEVRKYGSFYRKKQTTISNGVTVNCWHKLFEQNNLPADIWKGVPGCARRS